MLNLVLDARMINYSGIGTYIKNLIPYLKEELNLTLLGNKTEIEKHIDINNIRIISTNSPIYSPFEQIEIPLKITNCDVFWSPHFNTPILPVKTKRRLITIHDVFHLAFSQFYNSFEIRYIKFLIDFAVRSSDRIITVSNFSREEIIKYTNVKEEKISVIYNGVDTKIFKKYEKEELNKVKIIYNLPDNFILYVGNLKPHKNIKNAILAFKNVSKEIDDLYFLIIGKKEGFIKGDREVLELLSKDKKLSEKIIFTGFIDKNDLPKIYNLAKVFVFPSLYEGFGLPPLEAMACSCPVVASNIPVIWEICENSVYYVNPYDPLDIARGIREVYLNKNLRLELINKGLNRAKLFSWEESANKHLSLIFSL